MHWITINKTFIIMSAITRNANFQLLRVLNRPVFPTLLSQWMKKKQIHNYESKIIFFRDKLIIGNWSPCKITKLHSMLQYFSDFMVHMNYCRILLNLRFHFSRSAVRLRFCISNKLAADTTAAGPGPWLQRARAWLAKEVLLSQMIWFVPGPAT